jgi:hypothetical protein
MFRPGTVHVSRNIYKLRWLGQCTFGVAVIHSTKSQRVEIPLQASGTEEYDLAE